MHFSGGEIPTPRFSASLVVALLAVCLVANAAGAEPQIDETALIVHVDEPFEVKLDYQAATGATWIARNLSGVTLMSQDQSGRGTAPGSTRQIVFHLVARETGNRLLEWDLIGSNAETIYRIYRLRLRVTEGP